MEKYAVIIIGAGPIGLFLGLRLQQLGLNFIILDKKSDFNSHSRAIGIHPVSMELLEKLNVHTKILDNAFLVNNAHVYICNTKISEFDLSICKKPYNYITSIQQAETEKILLQVLLERKPGCVIFNALDINFTESNHEIIVNYQQDGKTHTLTSDFLVGADGKNSVVRNTLGINFTGELYAENYIMGDLTDNSSLHHSAALFICEKGVVESFPLPHNQRRWVINVNKAINNPTADDIVDRVQRRLGITLNPNDALVVTKFKTQGLIASEITKNRILLVGDAACVVSPIGGQGMNLGWLNAWEAAQALYDAHKNPITTQEIFKQYAIHATKRAQHATKRAAFYRMMGHKTHHLFLKKILARFLCMWPMRYFVANMVTMRYL